MAVCADAVLIPEIPYDLEKVAAKLRAKLQNGRHYALVVVAEGAAPVTGKQTETVSVQLQRLMDRETCPLAIGQLVRDGSPTAVDRQLGLRYGASAVRALKDEQSGSMVVFQPDLKFVPLAAAINRVRRVPANSEFVHTARSLGISLGD
jgi:6-phosphofructokinase 1